MSVMSRDAWECPAQAFKAYVKMILTRKNTITGLVYSEDPGIRLFNPSLQTSGGHLALRANQPTLCLALGLSALHGHECKKDCPLEHTHPRNRISYTANQADGSSIKAPHTTSSEGP